MEPFDIDKIIKEKVSQTHGLYQKEIDSAKPFVWSEIRREESQNKPLTWIHLAAAVLLLMLCFSVILINVQKKHVKEMENLSAKMNQIQSEYAAQTKTLETKTNQIATLTKEQTTLKDKLSALSAATIAHQKRIVYHTDTVIIRQVEYINAVSTSIEPIENSMGKEALLESKTTIVESKVRKVDDIIFPSYENQEKPPETLKVKFGSFVSSRN